MNNVKIFFLIIISTTCVVATSFLSSSSQKAATKNLVNASKQANSTTPNFESNKTRTDKKLINETGPNKIIPKDKDLQASAAEYGVPNFIPPSGSYGLPSGIDCHSCNDQPWVPIYGRSLAISQHKEFHTDSAGHDFLDKISNLHHFYPSLDEYGAPQSGFQYPRPGEIVEFMLPPPFGAKKHFTSFGDNFQPSSSGFGDSLYPLKHRKPSNFRYSSLSGDMLPPPPYASSFNSYPTSFGSFGSGIKAKVPQPYSQTSLSSEGHPGIGNLPLSYSNFNIQSPVPSNSYGQPLFKNHVPSFHPLSPLLPTLSDTLQLPSVEPSDSYGSKIPHGQLFSQASPVPQLDSVTAPQQKLPFLRPSDSYGQSVTGTDLNYFQTFGNGDGLKPPRIESMKATLFKTGATDVQVVPSVKIADYTASVEHPINLIQSPILDVVAKNPVFSENENFGHNSIHNEENKHNVLDLDVATNNDDFKLSEKPISVSNEDSHSSASSIVNSTLPDSTTNTKRHNDKYLSTLQTAGNSIFNENINWFKNMILENNKENVDKKSIVAIKKMIIDPSSVKAKIKIAQPNVDISTWRSLKENTYEPSDHMTPPKPQSSAWTNIQVEKSKPKPIQIIVPYVTNSVASSKSGHTTLSSIVTPPLTNAEQSLWIKYPIDQTVESNTVVEKTTQVYNIKDFISENAHKPVDLTLPYDVISLQNNIDKWTHQSYSNIKEYGAAKGVETDIKKKPDIYLKNEGQESITKKTEIELDPIQGSSSDKVEEFVKANEIDNDGYDDLSNDIDSDDDWFNTDTEENDKVETTTKKKVEFSSYPTIRFGVKQEKQLWNFVKETKSNSTHEKVYVVTPQSYAFVTSTPATAFSMAPKIQDGKVNKYPVMTKISVRVERGNITRLGDNMVGHPVKVVYSEWPHIINNLQTTTSTSKPTTRHPLLGLMDLTAYTPPPNSTVETLGGHSKVTMVVTPPTKSETFSNSRS